MDERLRFPGLSAYTPGATATPDMYSNGASAGTSVKDRQIAELRQAVPDCRSKNAMDSLLELAVIMHDGALVHLNIAIPPSYPKEAPRVSVVEFRDVEHFWVNTSDGTMTVHCLDAWKGDASAPSLTEIVTQAYVAITGREYTPPPPAHGHSSRPTHPHATSSSPGYPTPPSASAGAPPGAERLYVQPAAGPAQAPGAGAGLPGVTARLEGMSTEQLEALLTDGVAFEALLRTELQGTADGKRVEALHSQQASMARANLALLSDYASTEQQILISKQGELPPAQKYYDEVMARQTAVISKLDPSSLLGDLRAEMARTDEKARLAEQEFLSSVDVTEQRLAAFVSASIAERTHQHALEIKLQAASRLRT